MRLENIAKPKELTPEEEERIYGKVIKKYNCGCIEREGPSRGFCSKHWGNYFAGIKNPEYKAGEGPDYIEDDFS